MSLSREISSFLACTLVSRTSKTSLEMHDVLLCFVRQNPRNSLCSVAKFVFWKVFGCSAGTPALVKFWSEIYPDCFEKPCDPQEFHPQHLMDLTKTDKKLQNVANKSPPKNRCKQIPPKKHGTHVRRFLLKAVVWFVSFFCLNSSEETFEIHLYLDLNLPNKSPRCWRKIFWFICVKWFVFR